MEWTELGRVLSADVRCLRGGVGCGAGWGDWDGDGEGMREGGWYAIGNASIEAGGERRGGGRVGDEPAWLLGGYEMRWMDRLYSWVRRGRGRLRCWGRCACRVNGGRTRRDKGKGNEAFLGCVYWVVSWTVKGFLFSRRDSRGERGSLIGLLGCCATLTTRRARGRVSLQVKSRSTNCCMFTRRWSKTRARR